MVVEPETKGPSSQKHLNLPISNKLNMVTCSLFILFTIINFFITMFLHIKFIHVVCFKHYISFHYVKQRMWPMSFHAVCWWATMVKIFRLYYCFLLYIIYIYKYCVNISSCLLVPIMHRADHTAWKDRHDSFSIFCLQPLRPFSFHQKDLVVLQNTKSLKPQ